MFEITLTRGYDENSFREDLKGLYSKLGLENKKMVFLFTDAHVAQEGNYVIACICLLALPFYNFVKLQSNGMTLCQTRSHYPALISTHLVGIS